VNNFTSSKSYPCSSSKPIKNIVLISLLCAFCFLYSCEKKTKAEDVSFFTEISDQVNLDFIHNPGVDGSYYMPESIGSGAAFLDFDNDGDLDIYLVNCNDHNKKGQNNSPSRNQLFRQESDGTFSNVTENSGLGDTGYGMGVAIGDYNNDGYVDVYISNDGPDTFYRNTQNHYR